MLRGPSSAGDPQGGAECSSSKRHGEEVRGFRRGRAGERDDCGVHFSVPSERNTHPVQPQQNLPK